MTFHDRTGGFGADDSCSAAVSRIDRSAAFQNQIFEQQQAHRPQHPSVRRSEMDCRREFLDAFNGTHKARMKDMMKTYEREYK